MGNGIKFTDDGFVSLNIEHGKNDTILFKIKDSGIGISKENQSKLFSAFNQIDNLRTKKYEGTGLGLVISKKLIELMDGDITFNSKVDVGTCFDFSLKLPKGNTKIFKKQQKNSFTKSDNFHNEHILLVEDNAINRDIFVGFLKSTNLNIEIALNGKEAVKEIRKNPTKYALIFMDIQMPVMDGYEATKLIRRINPNLNIIALTANAMKEDELHSKIIGMNDFLSKPIDIKKLFSLLTFYLDHKEQKIQKEDIFKIDGLDTNMGLANMGGDLVLYKKVLHTFYDTYKDLTLSTLDNVELKRTAHTIKSTALGIGDQKLSMLAKEIETSSNITQQMVETLQKYLDNLILKLYRSF